jgi:cytochrome c-type biogenesis protein CcmH/NrfF
LKFVTKRAIHRKLILGAVLSAAPFALAADRERVEELGQHLMCPCSCNQTLTFCNHLNCPNSPGMKAEVAQLLDEGKTDQGVLDAFVEKYGVSILSSPPASGFNLSAWLMPFVALAAGIGTLIYFVRTFRSRWAQTAATGQVDVSKYGQRLEEELRKFTPED